MDAPQSKGLDFFLLYLATLKINDSAQYKAFTSPEEAEDFLPSVHTGRPSCGVLVMPPSLLSCFDLCCCCSRPDVPSSQLNAYWAGDPA